MPTWIVYALLSMLFAGMTSVIAKFGMKNISSDLALAIRTSAVFAFVWLNIFAFKNVKDLGNLTKKDCLFLVASGITTTFSWIFYYRAIKDGNVSTVAVIDKASIIITLILSVLILNEDFTWRMGLAATLILSGLLILVWK